MNLSKSVRSSLVIIGFFILLFAGGYFVIGRPFVPDNFVSAREAGALIAKDIVLMTQDSISNLTDISRLDRQYKFKEALVMVREQIIKAVDSRAKAFELTKELEKMVRSAQGINPPRARNLVIEAIAHENSLIIHLIAYNDSLKGLLQTLEYKFSGDIRYDSAEVQNLIGGMNDEAAEINKLNDLFNEKMKQFDAITG